MMNFNLSFQDLQIDVTKYLSALLLLLVTMSGGFTSETLGCSTKKLLKNNHFLKHIMLLLSIYFTLNFAGDNKEHPGVKIKNTIILYLYFLIFTKTNIYTTIIIFITLIIIYIINNYITYYKKDDNKNKKVIENLEKILKLFEKILFFEMIIGFIIYVIKQKNDHKNNFNYFYFIFGKNKCDND